MYVENADVGVARRVLETEDALAVAWNTVVACCARLGLVDGALDHAERMAMSDRLEPSLATWNVVSRHGRDQEAFGFVRSMLERGMRPDSSSMSSLYSSLWPLASLGLPAHGMEAHCFFLRHQLEPDVYNDTTVR